MNVEADGHLSLGWVDLREERKIEGLVPELRDFTSDAQIAASFALVAGYRVTYATPGILSEPGGPSAYHVGARQKARRLV